MRCTQRHTFISPMKVPCAYSAKSIVRFRGGDKWPGARWWECRRQSRRRLRPLSNMRKHGARNEGLPQEVLVGEESDGIADGTLDTGLVKLRVHQQVRVPGDYGTFRLFASHTF